MSRALFSTFCALLAVLVLTSSALGQATDLRGWEDLPGLFGYVVQPESAWRAGVFGVECRPVRDRVAGAGALALTFRGEGEPAAWVYRPPGEAFAGRTGYIGISIWVKGDGSEGVGVLGIGDGSPNDPRVTFDLRQKSWQPVRVRWEAFRPPFTAAAVRELFITVTPATKRPATVIVDKLELIRGIGAARDDEAVRAAGEKAAKEPEVARPADVSKFVAGRERFADLRAKLDAKKPVRVLVLGDTLAAGASLWNVPSAVRSGALFWGHLDRALKAKSPEAAAAPVFVEGPEAAAQMLPALLRAQKPDAVVIALSCSAPGVRLGAEMRAREAVKTLLEICRNARVEALAAPIPPLPDAFRRVDYAAILIDEAAKADAPSIAFGAFAAARGRGFEGEYYAAPDALNLQGHAALAQIIEYVLVNP